MGKNDNGQLGDGTVENKNSRSAVKAYVMTIGVEADGNGTASGGGQFAYGQTGSFSSSPNTGYIFGSWNGPLSGYSSSGSLTISGDIEANASFDPSPYDGDGDGLSDHYETVIFGSNPNNTDSDGDGFSDLEENNTGLDPNVPDTVLRNLFNSLTNDAYNSAFDDGVQEIYTDRKSYDLNSSSEVQYEYGHADGLSHAVQYQEDNNDSLYTLTEVNSARSEYQVSTTAFIREEITNGLSGLGTLTLCARHTLPMLRSGTTNPTWAGFGPIRKPFLSIIFPTLKIVQIPAGCTPYIWLLFRMAPFMTTLPGRLSVRNSGQFSYERDEEKLFSIRFRLLLSWCGI